jgi:hypothetical protein
VTSLVPAAASSSAAGAGPQVWVNVEGVSDASPLTLELLEDRDRPLPGYSGAGAARVTGSGTRKRLEWPAHADRRAPAGRAFAVRASFPETGDVRLYAVYVGP